MSRSKFVQKFHGLYVLELLPESDGLPAYSNGGTDSYCESYTFRAKFLEGCADVLDEELLMEAWGHHTAAELMDYGKRLSEAARAFAQKHEVADVLGKRLPPQPVTDWDDPAVQAHIVDSAARWCAFWSERGHGMIADF